jgi:hypothetical protein
MDRSTLEVNLQAKVVKVAATVELRTENGTVVGTTEVDLTPELEPDAATKSFGGKNIHIAGLSPL